MRPRSAICKFYQFQNKIKFVTNELFSGFYIVGIMMYKFGLEFFNGSITTLATDRFNSTNTFTKRKFITLLTM